MDRLDGRGGGAGDRGEGRGATGIRDFAERSGSSLDARPDRHAVRQALRSKPAAARRGRRAGRRREEAMRTPEEKARRAAVRRARRRAHQRIGFVTHAGTWAATLGLLLVATRSVRLVLIVGTGWGIGLFSHYLWSIAAPRLRDRWVEAEVGQKTGHHVEQERRTVGSRSRRSLEDLSASIAHEIRNPITAAKSLVQQMGEDPASEANLEYAGLALSELDRVERSIAHLLRYAREEEPRFEPVSLRAITESAAAGLRERAEASGIPISVAFDGEGRLRGDGEKLRRVIENLIANAIDAQAGAGTSMPRIELQGGRNLAGDEVWLRVIDDGPGIPVEACDRIWSPFFTTKEGGTGLGLALSRKTVEAHGGRIELLTASGRGTEFVLTFPTDPVTTDREA